ncbi:RHS repeat-associated core domain-containing protein, partial [Pontimicrobium sp. MEBiC01747]
GNIRLSYGDIDGDGIIDIAEDTNNDGVFDTDIDGDGDLDSEIIEENNYYPFGLRHKGYNNVIIGEHHPYGYNGKEEQNEFDINWYDLGARNHDPAIGRFMNLDPKAEDYYFQSTYAFAANNPVFFIDYNGEGVETDYKVLKKDDSSTGKKKGEVVRVDPNDGSENNATDRILKTDRQGRVKTETDSNGNQVAKVTVDNVAKGILKEGQNFRDNHEQIEYDGAGQPTQGDIVDFFVQLSENELGVEIAGFETLSRTGKVLLTHPTVTDSRTKNDWRTSASHTYGLNQVVEGSLIVKAHFHTHPSGTGASTDINNADRDDLNAKARRNARGGGPLPSYIYNKNGRISY